MAMDEDRRQHIRAIVITSGSTLAGVVAAFVSSVMTAGLEPAEAATNTSALFVVLAVVALQLPIYQYFFEDFGEGRDLLYVAVMTFCLWFISWSILLATQAGIA